MEEKETDSKEGRADEYNKPRDGWCEEWEMLQEQGREREIESG